MKTGDTGVRDIELQPSVEPSMGSNTFPSFISLDGDDMVASY